VTSSGMAAISTSLFTVLNQGDHVLVQPCLYGATHQLITKDLPRYGISYDFIQEDPASWGRLVRTNTKALYVETLTNPLLQMVHHQEVLNFTRKHDLLSIIDNTFASPVNFCPLAYGYDLVLESATKYLNGHSDVVAGVVAAKRTLVDQISRKLSHFGGCLDPHACFLLHRGLKTLAVRVRHQNESALEIAKFLERHESVERVHYPGLPNHPQHGQAKELFHGFGGMLAFELCGGAQAAQAFIKNSRLALDAASLGGPESLLTRPAMTSHAELSVEERVQLGITAGLIRMSVGLEDPRDLLDDYENALRDL